MITQVPAHVNNYGVGRAGKSVNKIILHWIVGTLESADTTFKNPDRKASAHYGIGDGDIHQYVQEADTAWHASNLTVNRESIGIEHEGGWLLSDGKTRFKPTDKTHETSAKLVADIAKRYNIPLDRDHILPHNKYSSTQCPGTLDIDRIITLAKQQGGDPVEDEFNKCRIRRDELHQDRLAIIKALEGLPEDATLDTILRSIAAYKGLASKVQTLEAEKAQMEINRKEQVSRLENEVLTLGKERDTALKTVDELRRSIDEAHKEKGRVELELAKCQAGCPPCTLAYAIAQLFRKK